MKYDVITAWYKDLNRRSKKPLVFLRDEKLGLSSDGFFLIVRQTSHIERLISALDRLGAQAIVYSYIVTSHGVESVSFSGVTRCGPTAPDIDEVRPGEYNGPWYLNNADDMFLHDTHGPVTVYDVIHPQPIFLN